MKTSSKCTNAQNLLNMKTGFFLSVILLSLAPIGAFSAEECDSADLADVRAYALKEKSLCSKQLEFPGGRKAYQSFLKKNFKYPRKALQDQIQGRVKLELVVEADGTVSKADVISGLSPECDAEALRLVSLFPKLITTQKEDKAIATTYFLTINFVLAFT
jgi:TonB family protein